MAQRYASECAPINGGCPTGSGRVIASRAMRRWVLAVGLLLLVAGCGQTDFATQVTSTGAQLNATITTRNQGTSTSGWFQWWPASDPSNTHDTTHRSVTSTGPFQQAI